MLLHLQQLLLTTNTTTIFTATTIFTNTTTTNTPSTTTTTTTAAPTAPKEKVVQEMDYVTMLNRTLPEDIRVLGWTPVTDEFSAR